jgi:hypothetical protein
MMENSSCRKSRCMSKIRASHTRVLQRICFATMESALLLSLEIDCRFWIVSLCVEERYCSFDPPSSGLRIVPIVWTIWLSRASSAQCSLGSEKIILRPDFLRVHEISSIHPHEKRELWLKFLRRIRDVGFARKQIEKYVQGIITMITLWSCK